MSLLEFVHIYTGMPWWASLAVTTAALRTVLTLPLMAYSMNNRAKLERLQPEIGNMSKELMTEVMTAQEMYGWDSRTARSQFRINVSIGLITAVTAFNKLFHICRRLTNNMCVNFCILIFVTVSNSDL